MQGTGTGTSQVQVQVTIFGPEKNPYPWARVWWVLWTLTSTGKCSKPLVTHYSAFHTLGTSFAKFPRPGRPIIMSSTGDLTGVHCIPGNCWFL
jgi:hypothetical protein